MEAVEQARIRNFAIISHIDHGKSTLADGLMELVGLLPRLPSDKRGTPRIDRMELEIERGVTIKLKAVRLPYTLNAEPYTLNMIDTPGHVDFSYEVSRSLAACEGALLLVDATQGPQAQTVAHLEKAWDLNLSIIGVINKIDSPLAKIDETEKEMRALGIEGEVLKISALKGWGIEAILEAIIMRVPSPRGNLKGPFRSLVFDSTYDEHLGVIAYVRVMDGALELQVPGTKSRVKFLGTGEETNISGAGYFIPERKPASKLSVGEVGYLATGLKKLQAVQAGDTATLVVDDKRWVTKVKPLPGYKKPQSFVFASFFLTTGSFIELKEALNKLKLEEPAISVEETSSPTLGRGFKLGFLGTFHLEIVKERLEREFNLKLLVTKPTVVFRDLAEEPWIRVVIITVPAYLPRVMKLITKSRGRVGEVSDFGSKVKLLTELPLMEFVRGFYDQLKSLSSGYASLAWEFIGYRPVALVRLDVFIHGRMVDGLSEVVLKEQAMKIGREKVKKLKVVMPQRQFTYAIQAKVGGKVLAREDVPALRKDVTAPLYGGDITRKRKLLERQKKGKKRLAKFGRIEVPPKAFLI